MSEPTITLPLKSFLQILWGYKKHAELRDRATPEPEIIDALKAIPNINDYVFIQERPDCMATVWQISEWRSSGEKLEKAKQESDRSAYNVEVIYQTLMKNPMYSSLGNQFARDMAYNLDRNGDLAALAMFGIKKEELR